MKSQSAQRPNGPHQRPALVALVCAGAAFAGASGCAPTPHLSSLPPTTAAAHPTSTAELNALARVIRSGVRTAMLAGDGLTVRDFMQDLQESTSGVSVALYSAAGEHVYASPPPPPPRATLPAGVREVLATGKPNKPPVGTTGPTSFALPNEDRCRKCHKTGDLRAVLTIETDNAPGPASAASLISLGKVVEAAFDAMMTLGKSSEADTFINALAKEVPGVKTAAVFSKDGKPTLGDGFMEVPADVAKRAVSPVPPFTTALPDKTTVVTIPLPNAPRCLSCHKASEMRGAIVLQVEDKLVASDAAKALLTSSMQHVMLTGLGRLTKKFLDNAARTGLYTNLTVHDSEGRIFHDIHAKAAPPAAIAQALTTGQSWAIETPRELTVVLPVKNEEKCRRCHDESNPVRAVIAITRTSAGEQAPESLATSSFTAKSRRP